MSEPLYEMRDVGTSEDSLIELQEIEKHFGAVIALAGVSVAVYAGECHCLLGDNGAGKSTFIKTMAGVHKPTTGQILMGGQPVMFESPRDAMLAGIATVYQDLAMIPLMSGSPPRDDPQLLDGPLAGTQPGGGDAVRRRASDEPTKGHRRRLHHPQRPPCHGGGRPVHGGGRSSTSTSRRPTRSRGVRG